MIGNITPDMARKELARRELEKRKKEPSNFQNSDMINTFIGKIPRDVSSQMVNNQALAKNILGVAASGGGSEQLLKYISNPITKKSMIKNILTKHDALEKEATEGFEKVSGEVKKREVPKIEISENFVDNLNHYFPDTKQTEELLGKAKLGDYDSLRKIQSELYKRGKKNLQSDFETDRMRGEEMLDRRDIINKGISDHLNMTGNVDLANILNKSRSDFRTLQEIYYNPNMSNSIKKLVNIDTRKIPKNLHSLLKEESIPMKNFLDFHPGLESQAKKYAIQKAISSKVLKYGVPSALAYELFKGHTKIE